MQVLKKQRGLSAVTAMVLSLSMLVAPLAGCGGGSEREIPPPVDDTRGGTVDPGYQYDTTAQNQAPERQGMSTKKKVAILAGAAALYYLYKKHQNAKAQHGPESQYYLSKNGRIYYRDETGRAHWVTPPPQGIQVPEHEANAYRQFEGYNNQPSGMDLQDIYNMEMGGAGGPGR